MRDPENTQPTTYVRDPENNTDNHIHEGPCVLCIAHNRHKVGMDLDSSLAAPPLSPFSPPHLLPPYFLPFFCLLLSFYLYFLYNTPDLWQLVLPGVRHSVLWLCCGESAIFNTLASFLV